MAKEDIQWVVLGILILLVVALVIKPMATGEPPNIGLPTPTPEPVLEVPTTIPSPVITLPPVPTTTATPTPMPTWDKSVQTVQFVDPSTYGVNLNQSLPNSTKIPTGESAMRDSNLTKYAAFSGQYSGTTQVVSIPFPYWELWYYVEPISSDLREQAEVSEKYVVTPTHGTGRSMSGFSGSYSTAMPQFSIQVMDAEDPNRIVRTISPPGGIDPTLWTEDATTAEGVTIPAYDPRPWKERFYEGQRSYYFIIKTAILKSYNIDIYVPASYVGKY